MSFTLYSSRSLKDDIYIGRVDIDLNKFLTENSIEDVYNLPIGPLKQKFVINPKKNSFLTVEISFISTKYEPINFDKIKSDIFHVFLTYSPPLKVKYGEISELPVEVELFQSFPVFQTDDDRKNKIQKGVYFTLDKENTWDEVGFSTMKKFVPCPTGISQIQTLSLSLINGKAEVFILNVSDYNGTVTLHFVSEKKGKFQSFHDCDYFVPKNSDCEISEFHKIDVVVEKNKKYVVPLCINYIYPRLFGGQTLNNFPQFSFEKSDVNYQRQILNEILKIVPNKIISGQPNWTNCNFSKTYVIPYSQKVSLSRILNDFQLPPNMNFKAYVGGSAKNYTNNVTFSGYWTPTFIVFDSKSGNRCHELERNLVSESNMRNCNPAVNYLKKQIFGFVWTFCVDLNFDQIESNKVIVFCVKTGATLENCFPPGSLTIVDANKGNLLLRKQINVNAGKSKCATCLIFQFSEDGWDLIPLFEFFKEEEEMNDFVNELHKNKWNTKESFKKQIIDAGINE